MSTLPEPDFIERDPLTIEREVFADYESFADSPASPGTVEYFFCKLISYRETLLRMGIQEAAKLNLLDFTRFPMLDYVGRLVGAGDRLPAQPATTTLQFTLPAAHGAPVFLPAGTRRKSNDGKVTFETLEDLTIDPGDLSGTVAARATEPGEVGNGYLAGQISKEVDQLPNDATCTNTTASEGGSPRESDERYTRRILLAPDSPSTAGAEQSYEFWALTASGAIVDVAVLSPEPAHIEVVVLTASGVPGPEILTKVGEVLTPKKRRPMSDTVTAVACTAVTWALEVELTLFEDADEEETLAAANKAAQAWIDSRKSYLGRDVVRSQIQRVISSPGVYDSNVVSPASNVIVDESQWANCTGITITVADTVPERMGEDL